MDATAYKNKGNEAFAAKNYAGAIENFSEAIELDSTNHVLFSNRSASYAALSKYKEALADAERCVALNGSWPKGYTRLGAAYHGLKQYEHALDAYKKAKELDPSNTSYDESIASIEKDKHSAKPNPFGKIFGPDCFARIQTNPRLAPYLQQQDYVQTINTLMQHPNMIQGFLQDKRIMQTFMELSGINLPTGMGEDDDDRVPPQQPPGTETRAPQSKPAEHAKSANAPSSAAKPPVTSASKAAQLKEQGNTKYKERNFDEALSLYQAAFAEEPTNTVYLLNATAVYFEKAEYEKCIEECEKALEHGREHKCEYTIPAKLLTRQACCLQRLNRHHEAVPLFKKALLEHRNPDTLAKLDACEKEKKRLDEEAYLNPEIAQQKKDEGNAFFKEDKFPEAVAAYSEAIKRNPKEHTSYSNRAAAYLKLGAYDDAMKDCEACLAINPTFVKAIARKGHSYFWTKQYHRAIQTYEEGLKLDPNNADCKDGLYRTQMKIREMSSGEGDEEAARRALADPEIAAIMQDSYMQLVLGEMQKDPGRVHDYLRDPTIASKINKLISAGILRFGNGAQQKRGK